MSEILNTSWISLKKQIFDPEIAKGEHLIAGNPYAESVAKVLFYAEVRMMGMGCRKGYLAPVYEQQYNDIRIVLQGKLTGTKDGRPFEVNPGDLSFTPPGTMVSYETGPNDVTWWMYISMSDKPNWDELKKGGSFEEKNHESSAMIFMLLRRMLDAYKTRNKKSINMALAESQMLLRLLRGLIKPKKDFKQYHALRELVTEISNNPNFDWTQSHMAEKLSVSPRTLSRLFKSEYGCSPVELVSQRRFNHAIDLLVNTDDVMDDVALKCGYENITSFSRAFRKYVGESPGKYRKESSRLPAWE